MREKEKRLIISYLLGTSTKAEQDQLESAFFQDREFNQLVLALEEELIIDYIRGALSAAESAKFKSHFLSSSRRQARYQSVKNFLNCIETLPDARASAGN